MRLLSRLTYAIVVSVYACFCRLGLHNASSCIVAARNYKTQAKKDPPKAKTDSLFFSSFFTTVLSHCDFSHGKFGLPFPGKASGDTVALPNPRSLLGVFQTISITHRTLTWTTGPLTCAQMLMQAIAHRGLRGGGGG